MNGRMALSWRDYIFLLVAAFFLFGCVASSHRSGKTLDQGQFSFGAAHCGLKNLEEEDADMIQLFTLDGRVGVIEGLDVGAAHTWDLTGDNDGRYSTFWGDARYQFSNRENEVGKPYLTLGVLKGYVYHEEADSHITSFPVTISLPASETNTTFVTYRFENITEDLIPDEWEDPRHGFFLGSEFILGDPGEFSPVLGVDVGIMTSLLGGEGDMVLVLNAGVFFNSP